MSNFVCRVNHPVLRSLLRRGLLGLALLLPTGLWAGGHTIRVQPPNGVDDTAHIQSALDMAVASGPGCTVQLAAGRYLTQQLVTYNFHGTFKGLGKEKTTLEALPNLPVNPDANFCSSPGLPNSTTNRWPSLIIFVDGDIQVSDLSIKIPATHGTATRPWNMCGDYYTFLVDALRFMGTKATHASVERVAIEASPDETPSNWGWNVWNGVNFAGELPTPQNGVDDQWMLYYYLSGSYAVRSCTFTNIQVGVTMSGFLRDIRGTIGGSSDAGNVFQSVDLPIGLCAAENSGFVVSHNRGEGNWGGFFVMPWLGDLFVPDKPSRYLVHDNAFATTAPYAEGILLQDTTDRSWIRATVYNNTIELKSDFMWDGIGVYNTQGATLWNNTITGSGADAIGLWGSSRCTVIGNHLSDFFADPGLGLARIYLDPASSQNLVVAPNPLDTVLDQGTENKVIGGWPKAWAEAFSGRGIPAPPSARSDALKRYRFLQR